MTTTQYQQDWKEPWIDRMGLIVALSGSERFLRLSKLKTDMAGLSPAMQAELRAAIRERFTPSNGRDGCQSAMQSVRSVVNDNP
jgi:hypothetical protein